MISKKYTLPIHKDYPDDLDGRRRNKGISIFSWEYPCHFTDEWIEGFRVVASHECWTGAAWLDIVNAEETPSIEHAIEIAKEMQSDLYE
tara:strand:+ start:329 stop:595 length:267 start_codon:yes stop_codon:yes gene_type:complete